MFVHHKTAMISPGQALPGRSSAIPTAERHFVNGHALKPPFPEGMQEAVFGLGCFWGAERKFWQQPGVYVTVAGFGPTVITHRQRRSGGMFPR